MADLMLGRLIQGLGKDLRLIQAMIVRAEGIQMLVYRRNRGILLIVRQVAVRHQQQERRCLRRRNLRNNNSLWTGDRLRQAGDPSHL